MSTDLSQLHERFPGEFVRIAAFAEFWPEGIGEGPDTESYSVTIQIGFLRGAQRFDGLTFDEAAGKLWTHHSDNSLCGQCSYPVDNSGLCVMDLDHRGYRPQV